MIDIYHSTTPKFHWFGYLNLFPIMIFSWSISTEILTAYTSFHMTTCYNEPREFLRQSLVELKIVRKSEL